MAEMRSGITGTGLCMMTSEAIVNTSEFHLIDKILSGSDKAFEELMGQHMDHVYAIALGIVRNEALAEDITQDVFVIVFRKLRSFRKDSAFSTWLYRITVNRSLKCLKKEQKYVYPGNSDEMIFEKDQSVSPEEKAIEYQVSDTIRECVNTLPEKQRTVLSLRLEKDLTFREIAGILGRSVGGVKANYFHAVRKFKSAWEMRGAK